MRPRHRLDIRPMDAEDLEAATVVMAAAFSIDIHTPELERGLQQRVAHLLESDPGGCFVATRDRRIVGVAQAFRRERTWVLSLLAVDPATQSAGAGRGLLARTLQYGGAVERGLIVSSNDPRALRLYAEHGFGLRPTFDAEGEWRRDVLPRAHPGLREVPAGELDALEPLAREIRGAPHTLELGYLIRRGGHVIAIGERGFAGVLGDRGPWLLVARDEETATALLWAAIERAGEQVSVRCITGEQTWAIDVLLRAGLGFSAHGALCVRGTPGTLHPFLPSMPFA
jgi:ribosomal protein S18 acetylase RimI-like enzyme